VSREWRGLCKKKKETSQKNPALLGTNKLPQSCCRFEVREVTEIYQKRAPEKSYSNVGEKKRGKEGV